MQSQAHHVINQNNTLDQDRGPQGENDFNRAYLATKAAKSGHML